MTLTYGNTFHITGPLWGEKACGTELRYLVSRTSWWTNTRGTGNLTFHGVRITSIWCHSGELVDCYVIPSDFINPWYQMPFCGEWKCKQKRWRWFCCLHDIPDRIGIVRFRLYIIHTSELLAHSFQIATFELRLHKWLINSLRPTDANMRRQSRTSLVQMMACRLSGAKPLAEPMLEYSQLDP